MALPITYITDCADVNARIRLAARLAATIPNPGHIEVVGVHSDLEAAGNLVDALDGYDGMPAIIMANVAPRNGHAKRWSNGTPFGYLKVGETWVFSTIDGFTLSLLQKVLGEMLTIGVFEIAEAVKFFPGLSGETRERIVNTQFRSYEFLPRVAEALLRGIDVPSTPFSDVPGAPPAIWWRDCFGNCKTTFLPEEIEFDPDVSKVLAINGVNLMQLRCFAGLRNIPDGEMALTVGSSGLGNHRFVEIMKQGGSAAHDLRSFDLASAGIQFK